MRALLLVVGLSVVTTAWGPCSAGHASERCLYSVDGTCLIVGHSASEYHGATCLRSHANLTQAEVQAPSAPTLAGWQRAEACDCVRWFPADADERPQARAYRASIAQQCVAVPPGPSVPDQPYWF